MIVLDTHTLVWWFNGDRSRVSTDALRAIDSERDGGSIVISSISAWEIAMLVAKTD